MLKLAFRNIKTKPLRSIATILAIAVAVAMIFAMLSFKSAVYDFIYATETAKAGDSDIRICANSSSDRIFENSSELLSIDGVERVTTSFTLYALMGEEYVQLRGFQREHLQDLQPIDVKSGELTNDVDALVISSNASKHFGLNVGDLFKLSIGRNQATFFVSAIAEQGGYFLDDAPFQFVGYINGISRLMTSLPGDFCNEIYIKLNSSANIDNVINTISQMDRYANLLVERSQKDEYIEEQTTSLTAPVVLAGGAVLLLGIAIIAMLFMMSEQEKISLISKLSVVGATRKQIFAIFLAESVWLAFVGIVIGAGLSAGIFVGLLKMTLSSVLSFEISIGKLIGAMALGFVSAIVASIVPILKSFKRTIRENQLDVGKKSLWTKVLPIVMIVLCSVSVLVEFFLSQATGIVAILSLVLCIVTLGICITSVLRTTSKVVGKIKSPTTKIASCNIVREKRFARSVTILTVGMTISVMLFMAWGLTQSIFGAYISDFENMIFVTNIQSSVDVSQFEEIEGVSGVTKMVWKQGELTIDGTPKTMNILGSQDTLDMVDFEFITAKDEVYRLISSDEPCVFVDIALKELYGVNVGDTLDFAIDGETRQVVVGGILKHELFSGNYVVASSKLIDTLYGIKPDTVLITVGGDIDKTVGEVRVRYADKNYYVIKTLDAYKWDMESMNAVFDLIGTLAIVVAIFVFVVSVSATMIGRGAATKDRTALLNAGMSKNSLLRVELAEHGLVAGVSFVCSFAISVLLTSCLIHALRLFGMYFEFMYVAWIVAVVGGIMAIGYCLVPLVLNFKKGYNIKKI